MIPLCVTAVAAVAMRMAYCFQWFLTECYCCGCCLLFASSISYFSIPFLWMGWSSRRCAFTQRQWCAGQTTDSMKIDAMRFAASSFTDLAANDKGISRVSSRFMNEKNRSNRRGITAVILAFRHICRTMATRSRASMRMGIVGLARPNSRKLLILHCWQALSPCINREI